MAELIHEIRGNVLENIHHGRICVVDDSGRLLHTIGDPEKITFFRSSSKPLQALPVIQNGLHEKYGFTGREITIIAGSHAGEPMHLETILSMLEKTGYAEDDLIMLPTYPAARSAKYEMLRNGIPPRKALHNCAGKHIASMMMQEFLTGDHHNYWQPDSAAQKAIAACIAEMSEWPVDRIEIGIDGCGIAVFAVPQRCIALAFMKLACPDRVETPSLRGAVETLVPEIHRNNLMMRGTDYLCSVFNEDPNVVAKGGAQGVYGFGLKKERLGVSIKLEDGTEGTWPIICAEILRQLNYGNRETIEKLDRIAPREIVNDNKTVVGSIQPVFTL